jgi:uncharacterized membrane protein
MADRADTAAQAPGSDLLVDPQVVARGPGLRRRPRRVAAALSHRRRLRAGIVQVVYVVTAVVLGLVVPRISVGASVPASRATEMLVAVGAGFVPFIGIVYSMLFLVVQFGSTTYTPRLNLFRDDPIVWHAFAFFTGVIVFAFTAVFEVGAAKDTTLLVPIVLGVATLGAVTLMRALQTAAFKSIQLASILEQLGSRGRAVIDGVHPEPLLAIDDGTSPGDGVSLIAIPVDGRDVLWPRRSAVLQRVDVPSLLRLAEHNDACIHLSVVPGATIFDCDRVAVVAGGADLSDQDVSAALGVGSERTFDQDPALALRLLADIALRALSPAINDPTTAVQSLDVIADLLRVLIRRDLGVVVVDGIGGTPRVVVRLHTWEDYVSVALDEIVNMRPSSVQVRSRLTALLEGLVGIAPTRHRAAVEQRLTTVTGPEARRGEQN